MCTYISNTYFKLSITTSAIYQININLNVSLMQAEMKIILAYLKLFDLDFLI